MLIELEISGVYQTLLGYSLQMKKQETVMPIAKKM